MSNFHCFSSIFDASSWLKYLVLLTFLTWDRLKYCCSLLNDLKVDLQRLNSLHNSIVNFMSISSETFSRRISSSIRFTFISFLQRWNALEKRYNYKSFYVYDALWMIVNESAMKIDVFVSKELTFRFDKKSNNDNQKHFFIECVLYQYWYNEKIIKRDKRSINRDRIDIH